MEYNSVIMILVTSSYTYITHSLGVFLSLLYGTTLSDPKIRNPISMTLEILTSLEPILKIQ